MMKSATIWILFLCISTLHAQVGIGTTTPDPSAALDISSATRGLLIPRFSTEDRNAIENPNQGLTVYDKSVNTYSFFDGSRWQYMLNTGMSPEQVISIPGLEMNLMSHLISMLHETMLEDTAGIIYDSGGPEFHYSNSEDYVVRMRPDIGNAAIGYRFDITYNIATHDSLIFFNPLTLEKIAVFTGGTGEETIYHHGTNISIKFKSNESITVPGFAIKFYQVFEIGPQGIPPSVVGPWYYRPDDFSIAGGFHMAPNEQRPMGKYSFALGYASEAQSSHSIAMGANSVALGVGCVSIGVSSYASKFGSMALGAGTSATAEYAVSMGLYSIASGNHSMAINAFTKASGYYSLAQGYNTMSQGAYSSAFGVNTNAIGLGSMATGMGSLARGNGSTSIGEGTIANSFLSFVAGRFNDTTAVSTNGWINTDPLFIVGNGLTSSNRSNALTLFKNGNMTIAGTLTQNSDARLKQNIQRLDEVMSKLQQINGYRYQWNTPYADNQEIKIGLLAQEIEEVIPELVRHDNTGVMSVDYSGLIPYLLEAIKLQQQEIEMLKSRL